MANLFAVGKTICGYLNMKNDLMTDIIQNFGTEYSYGLYFTENIFDPENHLFRDLISTDQQEKAVRLLFVIDRGMADHHPELQQQIETYCSLHTDTLNYTRALFVPGGESAKNDPAVVDEVLKAIDDHHICRHSYVVVIGGGAVIDMTGYAATIAHRGIRHIRIPTTVLAQDDAAVGVKNGVNRFGKKNFLGTFAPPHAIINDSKFLESLDQRDWISGAAEAVKVALIRDAEFFKFLEENAHKIASRDKEAMHKMIHRCAEIHMEHIAKGGDPFESGSSRPLDFGHWSAHKLEQLTNYELRHGEAVAKGIGLDVAYAHLSGLISRALVERIQNVMRSIGFDLSLPLDEYGADTLLQGLEEFREHLGGQLTITLINDIGHKHDVHEIDRDLMLKAMELVNESNNS